MSEKLHASDADRQRAYRERQQERRLQASAGNTDADLARAVREMHTRLEYEASQGDEAARRLLGATPVETLRKLVEKRDRAG